MHFSIFNAIVIIVTGGYAEQAFDANEFDQAKWAHGCVLGGRKWSSQRSWHKNLLVSQLFIIEIWGS